MREFTIDSIGLDRYEVTSLKSKNKKPIKTDKYIVDLRNHYCECKGWFYSKNPKICIHIKTVVQLLRAGGDCIRWNKKEQGHFIYTLK